MNSFRNFTDRGKVGVEVNSPSRFLSISFRRDVAYLVSVMLNCAVVEQRFLPWHCRAKWFACARHQSTMSQANNFHQFRSRSWMYSNEEWLHVSETYLQWFFNHGHGCGDFLCNAVDKLLSHFTFFTRGWNYSFVISICPLVSVTNEKNIFLIYSFVF